MYDSEGMRILTEQECRALLGSVVFGRIVFTDRALPAIQPVTFMMADGDVVVSTSASSKLAAAAMNSVVAFETDDFDSEIGTGWSVVVVGHARVVPEDGELSETRTFPLESWSPEEPVRYITITPELISGRRFPE